MADHYTCRITWSAEDGGRLGRCAEFPPLSWLAPTPDEALSGTRELVSGVLSDMRASGEPPPEPFAGPHQQRAVRGAGPARNTSGARGPRRRCPAESHRRLSP